MIDPKTAVAVAAAARALGSKKLTERLLGPTCDYLGGEMKIFAERRVESLKSVFEMAGEKLGDEIDSPGSIPPRVLKAVLSEGSYAEEELTVEYFGGVMASSRTATGRDDRGARVMSLIGRLSVYEIRAHFICYRTIRDLFRGTPLSPTVPDQRKKMQVFLPLCGFKRAMSFSEDEDAIAIIESVFFQLERERLLENDFTWGSASELKPKYAAVEGPGIIISPSAIGTELFMSVHGHGTKRISSFLDSELHFDSVTDVPTCRKKTMSVDGRVRFDAR